MNNESQRNFAQLNDSLDNNEIVLLASERVAKGSIGGYLLGTALFALNFCHIFLVGSRKKIAQIAANPPTSAFSHQCMTPLLLEIVCQIPVHFRIRGKNEAAGAPVAAVLADE